MYRYRCDQCRTTSPVVRTWIEVLHQRDRHRHLAHGGHRPDGEHLQRYRRPAGRGEIRPAVVVVALLGLLLLALITHR